MTLVNVAVIIVVACVWFVVICYGLRVDEDNVESKE